MTEQFILEYAPIRIKQLGYTKYYLRPRDFIVQENGSVTIPAYNELFFIVDDPPGVIVESDYGMYDSTDDPIPESIHVHRGEIKISNPGVEKRRIKFIQAIIVNWEVMALPNKEKYEPRKIDNLVQYLRLYQDKGQPIDFEILVDGFKAVRRTSDPDMFAMFENFVTADTKSIEVLLFTGSSNNNEKRIFYFGEAPKEKEKSESLSGIEVQNMIDDGVNRKMLQMQFEELQKKNGELNEEIKTLLSEINELEKQNAILEAKQSPLNSFLGDVGSSLVESFIKRNPKLMSSIPGGEALAGLLQTDNAETESDKIESSVSFKPTSEARSSLSQEDQAAIQFVNQLKSQFTKSEFDEIMLILQTLAEDKSKIGLILNHVNIKQQS